MNKTKYNDLVEIKGGNNSITGTIVNGFVSAIKVLYDAGVDLGSSIRRIFEGNLCPLK